MILKGSQRSGGNQLAVHLMRADENEHVEVHEIRGFMADDLHGAFKEAHAISKGTRAKQYLFSLSLNPPSNEKVSIDVFENAIERIEQRLGLDNQPRAIVFHEKEGRRHAHVVWSRIDVNEMKAINLPYYKRKLHDVSKELYLEHGWKMPAGFVDKKDRNPLNFSRDEWQQARRNGLDPRALKRMFQECWAISDSKKAFTQALLSRGYILARGDRRGFVAVDYQGEPYAIAKYTGVKTKTVRNRLGDPKELPSIEDARAKIGSVISDKLKGHLVQANDDKKRHSAAFAYKRKQLVERQRAERQNLVQIHKRRWEHENQARAKRISSGLKGVWHWLTGKYAKIKRKNEAEALKASRRDRKEKDQLIFRHIQERQALHLRNRKEQHQHDLEIKDLRQDLYKYRKMKFNRELNLKKEFDKVSSKQGKTPKQSKTRGPGFEPEI